MRYFAAWVGKEILKGAVLQTAVETWQVEVQKNAGRPGAAGSAFVDLLGRIVEALKVAAAVTKDWRQWTVKNYHQRAEYGMVNVENVVIYRFEVLRSDLADLDDELQKLAPKVRDTSRQASQNADMGAMREATVQYVKSCQDIVWRMEDKERLMVKKLEPRKEELQKAHDLL